ncbi:hypothetical protein [Cupriavidus sp. Agwp_2]|uniref:hypothetical protein n=1 Tax=Cupriavidus sp. Agwp_2 TaxID=2897324 RepID=UPI003460A806
MKQRRYHVITMLALAEAVRLNTHEDRATVMKRLFPADSQRDPMAALLERGVQGPADSVTPGWAAELTQQTIAAYLASTPASLYGQLVRLAQAVPLTGENTVVVPGRDRTKRLRFAWVAPGAPIPVSGGQLTGSLLRQGTLGAITLATTELLASSAAASVLDALLREDAAYAADNALFGTDAAVAGKNPAGLLFGLTPIPSTNPQADVRALLEALNNPTAPAFACNALQLPGLQAAHLMTAPGLLAGMPLMVSANIPPGRVVAVDAPDIAMSSGDTVAIEATEQGVVHEEDDPGAIVDEAGTVARPVRALWQTSVVAIRALYPTTWAARRADAVAYADVTW